jgi:hypothetical protein
MGVDGDPGPAVEPHAAFYGLWPKFADPAESHVGAPLRRERPTRHICGWWTADAPQGPRSA